MDAAPSKRPRTDDEPLSLTRSNIWYSDGSVVLQAESTQFRVHASILSAGSTVFKDMFQVAQAPSNFDSQVEGCPLVQLYDDTAHDVELVLEALYDRNFYKHYKKPFTVVSAMLRLGQKYEFDELRDDAVMRLESFFPPTLAAFKIRGGFLSKIVEYPGLPYDAINLARQTGLLSILPAALYSASAFPSAVIDIHRNILSGLAGAEGKLVHLSPGDKATCILATSTLLAKQWAGPYSWVDAPGETGISHHHCLSGVETIRRTKFLREPSLIGIGAKSVTGGVLCPTCEALAQGIITTEEFKLWDELPGLFSLVSWADIRK